MNVKVIKTVAGEEIISDLTERDEYYVLNEPMLVAVNDGRLVFIPYMQYTDAAKSLTLLKQHVILVVNPVDSLIDDYESATAKVTKPRKSIVSSVP